MYDAQVRKLIKCGNRNHRFDFRAHGRKLLAGRTPQVMSEQRCSRCGLSTVSIVSIPESNLYKFDDDSTGVYKDEKLLVERAYVKVAAEQKWVQWFDLMITYLSTPPDDLTLEEREIVKDILNEAKELRKHHMIRCQNSIAVVDVIHSDILLRRQNTIGDDALKQLRQDAKTWGNVVLTD